MSCPFEFVGVVLLTGPANFSHYVVEPIVSVPINFYGGLFFFDDPAGAGSAVADGAAIL